MVRLVLLVILSLFSFKSFSQTNLQQIASLIPIIQLLLLDDSIDPELLGEDENNNGTKDDLIVFIKQKSYPLKI